MRLGVGLVPSSVRLGVGSRSLVREIGGWSRSLVREIRGWADPEFLPAAADAVTTWSAPVRDQVCQAPRRHAEQDLTHAIVLGGKPRPSEAAPCPAHLSLLPAPPGG